MNHKDYKVFSVVGDGEAQEGEIWEAANTAHKYQLDNLIVFMDYKACRLTDLVIRLCRIEILARSSVLSDLK